MNRKMRGINKVISISKIKKISLIIKNWILKGIRVLDMGSKPHSKGEDFSRFLYLFFDNKKLIVSKINDNNIIIRKIMIKLNIIYINLLG